jgi:hypothetical protein
MTGIRPSAVIRGQKPNDRSRCIAVGQRQPISATMALTLPNWPCALQIETVVQRYHPHNPFRAQSHSRQNLRRRHRPFAAETVQCEVDHRGNEQGNGL